jgi:hypothetical protein
MAWRELTTNSITESSLKRDDMFWQVPGRHFSAKKGILAFSGDFFIKIRKEIN